ncbi:MAG: hypothetical protein V7731_06695 [Amphritea sp.]
MLEQLPSFFVLGSILITLGLLLKRAPNRKAATIVNCVLMTALCFIGGMLVSALYTRVIGDSANPMIISLLVSFGTFGSLAIYLAMEKKKQA